MSAAMADVQLRSDLRFVLGFGAKLAAGLIAVVAAVILGLPHGLEMRPPAPDESLSVADQHRAVAIKSHGVSHGCRASEPYPPVDEQVSALVEDSPGRIRLTSIEEGRAVLEGRLPGVLLAVCER